MPPVTQQMLLKSSPRIRGCDHSENA